MELKEQVKEYISIVDVASMYVNLKPAGKNLKALCPFHTEKTPSFFISPDRNTFNCYGCHRFGDIFTLVQEMESLDFRQAMEFLIDRFHVPVAKTMKRGVAKDEFFRITEMARDYFISNLEKSEEGAQARQYLKSRGVTRETIETFGVGYASNSWDGLFNHLQQAGIALEKAVELGLLVRSEKNRLYDRFRGRVIFPILSETGTTLAFGGRTIVDDEAKYLNSPESPIYQKGHHLYGFWLAKEAIRKNKAAVLVEGYMDMIMLHQAGIGQAVASLGTALTESQIYLLKRFADDIYLYYDSDTAGVQATRRALEKMLEQGISPRILSDPDVKDPDDFIRKKGKAAFDDLCGRAAEGFRFLLLHESASLDLNRPEKKRQAVDAVMEVVRRMADPILKDEYTQRTAEFFHVDPALLRGGAMASSHLPSGSEKALRIGTDEREFLLAMIAFPKAIEEVAEFFDEDLLSLLPSRQIIRQIIAEYKRQGEWSLQDVAARCNEGERALLSHLTATKNPSLDHAAAFKIIESCMLNFIKKLHKRKSSRMSQEIAVLERENNLTQVKKLIREKHNFKKQVQQR